jgi:hypothetical protein
MASPVTTRDAPLTSALALTAPGPLMARGTVPDTPDALLVRRDAAAALTAAGYPVAPATLATRAVRGGGPLFRRFGRVPLYRWGDLLDWAQSRLSAPMGNTSEADARMSRTTGRSPRPRSAEAAPAVG